MKVSVKRAEKIITGSEAAKADIVNLLNVAEEKVEVTRFGLEEIFHPVDDEKLLPLREKYRLPERFILFVGTIEPRKNILNLVRAFHKLDRDMSLVIAGRKGWLFEEIFKEVERLHLGERIIFLDYFSETDLPLLYNAASVFVYPSLYEGFGFPPLEAMACGTAVVASDKGALGETISDACYVVKPDSHESIANGIYKVITDSSLKEELIVRGKEVSLQFNWETAARQTLSLYGEVVGTNL
jgi:glycosyltransferase involved in cell wall biosynthesis